MSSSDVSIVYWCSDVENHLCGYCKDAKGSISHGMWAKSLTVEDYQNLIDRGWRRSGQYCYKPYLEKICCPLYTIRCNALEFSLSKSQKKVIKKFNKFIIDGELKKCDSEYVDIAENVQDLVPKPPIPAFGDDVEIGESTFVDEVLNFIRDCDEVDSNIPPEKMQTEEAGSSQACDKKPVSQPKSGIGADPAKPQCKKAKVLRLERKQEKLLKKGLTTESPKPNKAANNQPKSLEEFLGEIPTNSKHKFRLELVNTSRQGEDWERVKSTEYELFRKYQMAIHNDPPQKCSMEMFLRFLVHSPLKITLERIHETHEYFKIVSELYRKYQIAIHNDSPEDCDDDQFINFLIDTPLQFVRFAKGSDLGFGSFHQLYWLDDKLIAVGVIDILPRCISAVYFFYDPDYRSLTLGTYGYLRELEFTRSLHEKVAALQYYYMGFYIHSCPKMRYKGKLVPSFLACPETYRWIPIEKCVEKLDKTKYARFEDDPDVQDDNAPSARDIDEIKVLYHGALFTLKRFQKKFGDQETFDAVGWAVGRKCTKSLIFLHA